MRATGAKGLSPCARATRIEKPEAGGVLPNANSDALMLTYEHIFLAYEASLRGALLERLGGDATLLPASPTGLRDADRNVGFFALALYNDERRRVPRRRRRIHLSDEYATDARKGTFEPKLSQLLQLLEAGDSAVNDAANEFLSKTVEHVFWNRRGDIVLGTDGLPEVFQDYMLYDWGIHHFHIEPGRGKHLLFVMLRGDDAYVLKIGTHGQEFNDAGILEVAHRHWPQLLPQVQGITVEKQFTPDEIGNLRRGNVAYALNVAGKTVMPLDLRATNGTPVRVTVGRDMVARQLRALADALADQSGEWAGQLRSALGGEPDEVVVTLTFRPAAMAEAVLFRAGGAGPWASVRLAP